MKSKKVFLILTTLFILISGAVYGLAGDYPHAYAYADTELPYTAEDDIGTRAVCYTADDDAYAGAVRYNADDDAHAGAVRYTAKAEEKSTEDRDEQNTGETGSGSGGNSSSGGKTGSGTDSNKSFRLEAVAEKAAGNGYYDVTVTAYSEMIDLSGYVRLSVINNSKDSIAYDTRINLPEKTEKSFVVRIPIEGYFDTKMKVMISLLDDKKQEVYSYVDTTLFENAEDNTIYVGVLSSNFGKLSYLDLNGGTVDRLKRSYNIQLIELDENNIVNEIDRLGYLFIDDYDTSGLNSGVISKIENYVHNGGILCLGTGKNEDKTLRGFSADFIDAEILGSEEQQVYDYVTGEVSDMMVSLINYGYTYNNTSYAMPGMYKREGDGVILLSMISFIDPAFYNRQGLEDVILNTYTDSYNNTAFYYSYNKKNYVDQNTLKQYFKSIEGLKKVSINGLKWIIVIYVLLIGPVLYLILKKTNKREYFWIAIPAVTVAAMIVIMIYGGKFRLSNKNISNVTIASADGSGMRKTYMAVFSSKSGDITINLNDRINGVGSVFTESGDYNGRNLTDYRVINDGGSTKVYHDGSGSFDKGYLVGLSDNHDSGKISLKDTSSWSIGISGTLKNDTEYDFDYVLILKDYELVVVKGLKAGDKLAVSSNIVYSGYYYSQGDNVGIPERFKKSKKIDYKMLSALFLALDDLNGKTDEVIIGITSDYDSFAKGDVNELSYGCIYSIGTIE